MVTPKIGDTLLSRVPMDCAADLVGAAIVIRNGAIASSAMTTIAASKTTVLNEGNILCAEVIGITNSISVRFSEIRRATHSGSNRIGFNDGFGESRGRLL